MKRMLIAVVASTALAWEGAAADPAPTPYQTALTAYVDDDGWVDYKELEADRAGVDDECKKIGDTTQA